MKGTLGRRVELAGVMLLLLSAGRASADNCASPNSAKDLVETAVGAGQFTTLVTAVKAAGLVDTLKGDTPLTVFAPTDEAFAKLPAGTLEKLLANPDQLRAVLLYHVVPGRLNAKDVLAKRAFKTALGQEVAISSVPSPMIDNARIVATDVEAANGVIHVIDRVILPENDIVETARAAGSFNTLLTALQAAGLADALRGDGPFTVFAPTDAAFEKLPPGTLDALLKDKARLKSIVTYHVVAGDVRASDVTKLKSASTLEGSEIRIDASSGVKINDARVIKTDVTASNGVIHVIDTVLIPHS